MSRFLWLKQFPVNKNKSCSNVYRLMAYATPAESISEPAWKHEYLMRIWMPGKLNELCNAFRYNRWTKCYWFVTIDIEYPISPYFDFTPPMHADANSFRSNYIDMYTLLISFYNQYQISIFYTTTLIRHIKSNLCRCILDTTKESTFLSICVRNFCMP